MLNRQNDSAWRASSGSDAARRRFSISAKVVPSFIVVFDGAMILLVGAVSYVSTVATQGADPAYYATAVSFVCLAAMLLMNFAGLYQLDPIMRPLAYVDKIAIAFGTTILFLLAAAFALKISTDFSRLWIGSFALGAFAATLIARILASLVIGRLADKRVFSRNVVIVGLGAQAAELLSHMEKSPPRFISVIGLFGTAPGETFEGPSRYPVLGSLDELAPYARVNEVDDVIIALPWSADTEIAALVDRLRELPMNVYLASDLIGFRLPFRARPDHFEELAIVEVMGSPLAGWGGLQKTLLDYGMGAILAVLLLPLMVLIAIAIKLDSPGPVLFRQERYGFVNRIFRINKFRTMRFVETPEKETIQATRDDPRVTRVGRFLRRTSLDELPQLFNVLNGTMSLVGPRPHAIDHNESYAQIIRGYFARHRVKPGITGWAQVNGFRGETKAVETMEARVKYDIYYTENWSLLFDLRILAMTTLVWLGGRNAY